MAKTSPTPRHRRCSFPLLLVGFVAAMTFLPAAVVVAQERERQEGEGRPASKADSGVLTSLREWDAIIASNETTKTREEGSNLDLIETADGEKYGLCHLSALFPYTQGNYVPSVQGFEDQVAVMLAAHHLNTGDGSVVPEVQGLDAHCPIRFTVEFADTEYSEGTGLSRVVEQLYREDATQKPCAFIGPFRSAISIPTSIVTGLFGYPQISGGSTSADLDDTTQYPMYGRTVPSDAGTAVPVILFMRKVLNVTHLAVVNSNEAYGNAYVDGLRQAALKHAPDLTIHQIPLDNDSGIPAAVQALKRTSYRYVFCIVISKETNDALLEEAYHQGVAGTGYHNWFFGDSFNGVLDGRKFVKGSPLHLAYRGAGLLEVSGGVAGLPSYDRYYSKLQELKNPTDMEYIGSLFPKHPERPEAYYGVSPDELDQARPPFIDDPKFLTSLNGFNPFLYEATVLLGLSACQAVKRTDDDNHLFLAGKEHFATIKQTEFEGASGNVVLNKETGTRDPNSALYRVANYIERDLVGEIDLSTGNAYVEFNPVIASLFHDSKWNEQVPYIFNDGTAIVQADLPPPEEEGRSSSNSENSGITIGLSVAAAIIVIIVLAVVIRERKRQVDDSVWAVKHEELKFGEPVEVIGRGTFGLVLMAEYRGTKVAVKRVIPPSGKLSGAQFSLANSNKSIAITSSNQTDTDDDDDDIECGGRTNTSLEGMISGMRSGMTSGLSSLKEYGQKSKTTMSSLMESSKSKKNREKTPQQKEMERVHKKLKEEFIEEMRYLSKLRHPCITTVMGAVIGKNQEPMLVMEYMEHRSLYDLLHNETMALEGGLLLPMLQDISQGMRFLHSANPFIIHGDLKAQNILVNSRFHAKVADFGLSQKKNLGGTGTPFWMAPELLRGESTNTLKTDVYSFGIILYEVYSRRDPYEGEKAMEVLRAVADTEVNKRPPVPMNAPAQMQSMMVDCLEADPDERPSFSELDNRMQRIKAESAGVEGSKNKATALSLFDIFPRHIAEALRDGRTVEPEHRDSVTIFFSDIVGFTDISANLQPYKVAELLDRLYTKFDELSNKYDIFKVETIGDAYMAVTNLVKDQPKDHAKRIAEFSIDAIAAANETPIDVDDESKGFVTIRVGFHSGPVVADVVGSRNPRYCLFGDTVNTSSRMESNSMANRIHCSKAAANLLRIQAPHIRLKPRGLVNVKGKGKMYTFWVGHSSGPYDYDHPAITDRELPETAQPIPEAVSSPSLDQNQGSFRTELIAL